MSLYQRILGHPFVYDRVRPFMVGGIDWTPLYRNLEAGPDDVILDIGCGTGVALDYLSGFRAYYGFDTDPVAINHARARRARANVHYECAMFTPADMARIRPNRVVLSGLLHHLSDDACLALLGMCGQAPVRRIATSDVVYLPREHVGNLLAFLDRGRFVRTRQAYLDLIGAAGLKVVRDELVRSHPRTGLALYFMTALEPGGATARV